MNDLDKKDFVLALAKGLSVIKAFDKENTHMTLSDVAKKVDITRANARRLLLTLEHLGYVAHRDNFFYLTPKIIELGYSYYASLPWTDLAYKNLKQVANECKLSCSISILDHIHIICIMRIAAQRVLSEGIHVGTRLPTAYTATGRVYLAHMEDKKLKKFIKKLPLRAYTKNSITSCEELYERIKATRNLPYQIVQEELEDGLIAIASPIYNKDKEIIGTMNIGSHISYKDIQTIKEEVLPRLQQAAQQTSEIITLLQY
ncbi:MAG: IclR family transcriptional regulator [Proteobacteria bacterium]|nr:MAG: IclR family transcriptional regulator [Pseudomonadota bacterium]